MAELAQTRSAPVPSAHRMMVITGEASGDAHAAGLVAEARRRLPHLRVDAVGGKYLASAGANILHDERELSVVGISEVLVRLPALRRVYRDLKSRLLEDPPDLLLLVDFPDFNLKLGGVAARAGIPVVYFISPQVWAWRPRRVKLIRRVVRRMIVFFPFEETFYREHGVPVSYVGHPLVDRIGERVNANEARRRLGLSPGNPVIGLLPGSRPGEIGRLLEPMLRTASHVLESEPKASFLVPVAESLPPGLVEEPCTRSGLPVVPLRGAFAGQIDACDAALAASGTATLEVALRGVPPVVVYRTSWLTYAIGRMAVRVPHVSLVNLVARRRLVPELIQGEFEPEVAARHLLELVRDGPPRREVLAGLAEVRERLGEGGSYVRAAEALVDEIRGREEP
jgi:lipid-A-disaccharide synthase